jgi:hypothetical protein
VSTELINHTGSRTVQLNTEIAFLDATTILVTNLVYRRKTKTFIISDRYRNAADTVSKLQAYLPRIEFHASVEVNGIVEGTSFRCDTLHQCFAHAVIDNVFPWYWAISSIEENPTISRDLIFFVSEENIALYPEHLLPVIDAATNSYRGAWKSLISIVTRHNPLFEHLMDDDDCILFRKCYVYIRDDNHQRSPWNHVRHYPERNREKKLILYDDDTIRSNLRNFVSYVRGLYQIQEKNNSDVSVAIVNRSETSDRLTHRRLKPDFVSQLDNFLVDLSRRNAFLQYKGIIHLETLSLAEQIRTFAETDIVVAPHGAGLIHMIWSRNQAIFEVFPESKMAYRWRRKPLYKMYRRLASISGNAVHQFFNCGASTVQRTLFKVIQKKALRVMTRPVTRPAGQRDQAPRKPNLVYLCAFGKAYLDMARMAVWTIRTLGKLPSNDEIIILTDPATLHQNQETISELQETYHVQFVPFQSAETKKCDAMISRVRANDVIDFRNYDRVLYLDTDILVVNHLDNIFQLSPDKILCFEDIFPLERRWFAWEREMPKSLRGKLGVNSGLFCGSGCNVRNLLSCWIEEHKKVILALEPDRPNRFHDQPPFNKMVFDRPKRFHVVSNSVNIEKFTPVPPSEWLTECGLNQGNGKVSASTTFLHFVWMQNKAENMAEVFDVLTQSGSENIGNVDYYWKIWKMMRPS